MNCSRDTYERKLSWLCGEAITRLIVGSPELTIQQSVPGRQPEAPPDGGFQMLAENLTRLRCDGWRRLGRHLVK